MFVAWLVNVETLKFSPDSSNEIIFLAQQYAQKIINEVKYRKYSSFNLWIVDNVPAAIHRYTQLLHYIASLFYVLPVIFHIYPLEQIKFKHKIGLPKSSSFIRLALYLSFSFCTNKI